MARPRTRPQPPFRSSSLAIEKLRFDPGNPRFPPSLDGTDEAAVLAYMLDDASLLDLIGSIAEQGFFPGEPLLVCPEEELPEDQQPPEPQEEDVYRVVEGNRRFAALLLLRDTTRAPARRHAIEQLAQEVELAAELPVIIFPTRNSILDYLGYRHVTGIKEWDPIAKAQYLEGLRQRWAAEGRPTDLRSLARSIGSNAPYVGRLLVGVAMLQRLAPFLEETGVDPSKLSFSLLTTALNYDKIVSFLGIVADDPDLEGLDDGRLRELVTWLFIPTRGGTEHQAPVHTVLGESRNMRYLNVAVESPRAVVAMNEGASAVQAARLAVDPPRVFTEALLEARRQVRLAEGQLDEVAEPTAEDEEVALEVRSRADVIAKALADLRGGGAGA